MYIQNLNFKFYINNGRSITTMFWLGLHLETLELGYIQQYWSYKVPKVCVCVGGGGGSGAGVNNRAIESILDMMNSMVQKVKNSEVF